MFDTKKRAAAADRIADAVDLTIDFATLGEYGLEPVETAPKACESRHRFANRRSTGAWQSAITRFSYPS